MALVLDLTYSQSNDATTLTITDDAGTYHNVDNPDGWETGGATNYDPADIVISTNITHTSAETHLLLNVTLTDKNGTETVYDSINLYDQNGGSFVDASDLTWDLTPADFDVSGTAMGETTDKLTDGVYSIVYSLYDNNWEATAASPLVSFTEDIVVDGDVRIDVYNKLRQVSVNYDNEENDTSRDVMEALFAYSYLQSIEASSAVAMTEELINQLYTLDKLVSDGSHYTW